MIALDPDWPPPPEDVALAADEVHVWRVPLDSVSESDDVVMTTLSAAERERASGFRFKGDRDRFVRSRAALRMILASYLSTAPEALVFREGAHGKPFIDSLADAVPLRFNLSHSDNLALVAVACRREVGIDVERVRPVSDMAGIAARFFSPFEQQTLDRAAPADRLRAFFATWVLKEAYLKACGDGLVRRLSDFDVMAGDDEPPRLLEVRDRPGDAARWTLRRLDPGEGYVAALAAVGSGWRLRQSHWGSSHPKTSR
jgi:4'-phosphopantetheinyl transferase